MNKILRIKCKSFSPIFWKLPKLLNMHKDIPQIQKSEELLHSESCHKPKAFLFQCTNHVNNHWIMMYVWGKTNQKPLFWVDENDFFFYQWTKSDQIKVKKETIKKWLKWPIASKSDQKWPIPQKLPEPTPVINN